MLEKKDVKVLTDLGLSLHQTKILLFLNETKKSSSREIEFGNLLRQPEVSSATILLGKKGWLGYKNVKTIGRGRPYKVYYLKKSLKEILKEVIDINKAKIKEMEKAIKTVDDLKKLI